MYFSRPLVERLIDQKKNEPTMPATATAPAAVATWSAAPPLVPGASAGARLGKTPSGTGPPTGAASAAPPPLMVPIKLPSSPLTGLSTGDTEGAEAAAEAKPTTAKKTRARTMICLAIFCSVVLVNLFLTYVVFNLQKDNWSTCRKWVSIVDGVGWVYIGRRNGGDGWWSSGCYGVERKGGRTNLKLTWFSWNHWFIWHGETSNLILCIEKMIEVPLI